jgi:hypothetical protein
MWRVLGDKISLPSGIIRRRAVVRGIPQGELIFFPKTAPHKALKRSLAQILITYSFN